MLATTSAASTLDFKNELNQLCSPENQIVTKKILLTLVSNQEEHESGECNYALKILAKKCSTNVECGILISSFQKFSEDDSSNLIGE